jgi:hypothetical protein
MRAINFILFLMLYSASTSSFAAWKALTCVDSNQFTIDISFDESRGLVKLGDFLVVPARISGQTISYYWGGQDGSKYFVTLNRSNGILNTRDNASGEYVPAFKCDAAKTRF